MHATIISKGPFLKLIVLFIIGAIVVNGCESNTSVNIGFIASTSGPVADVGTEGLNAVQLAVEQWNERGGIGGHRIKLLSKNDRQDADAAVQAAQELIKEKVAAIVGPMTSNMAIAIIPCLNEARIIAVGPTIMTQRLSGIDDYFFRVSTTTYDYATRSAEYQIKSEKARKFVAIFDQSNRPYCESWLETFKERFVAGGGQIIATVPFNKEENKSFLDIIQSILAIDPEGILIIANAMDSALICHQIRKIDPRIIITMADWGANKRFIEIGGKAVEGVTAVFAFDPDCPNPEFQTFRTAYLDRYGKEPGFPSTNAYDAIQVVLTALNECRKGQDVKECVLSLGDFDGLQNKIHFDAYGDVTRSHVSIRIVHNLQFVTVE